MNHAQKMARDDFITEALRAASDAIGDDEPSKQAFAIIAAIKDLRDDAPPRLANADTDYLRAAQEAARAVWHEKYEEYRENSDMWGDTAYSATAGLQTPLGPLSCTTWRRQWSGARGDREAWSSEYDLNGEPITIREIREAGLAQRPTRRNRQKKDATK